MAHDHRTVTPAPSEPMRFPAMSMEEAMYEIANRAGNFMDADAAEWMPSIYVIACNAIGSDPMPLLKAAGFDGTYQHMAYALTHRRQRTDDRSPEHTGNSPQSRAGQDGGGG